MEKWKPMKNIFYVLIPPRLFIFVINNRDSFISQSFVMLFFLRLPNLVWFVFPNRVFSCPILVFRLFHQKLNQQQQQSMTSWIFDGAPEITTQMNWNFSNHLKVWFSLCFDDNLLLIRCFRWFQNRPNSGLHTRITAKASERTNEQTKFSVWALSLARSLSLDTYTQFQFWQLNYRKVSH